MTADQLSKITIGAAIKVHSALGPGLLESAYEECLYYEMRKQGYFVEKQKALPLIYETIKMECGYRVDLLVEGKLIIEVKATETVNERHLAQVLTYLRLSKLNLGLLLNFNVTRLKEGIRRVIND